VLCTCGNSYGSDVFRNLVADGEPVHDDQTVGEVEAVLMRRIVSDYGAGRTAVGA
jgi:hypothetical protein